jgi:predicted MPP superfamily phosphohydrolase
MKRYKRVLLISDLHIPFHHPDSFDFLKALKKEYKPDFVLNGGDETDCSALSFWDSNPDMDSAGKELIEAKKHIHELEKIFPKMILLHSNHSSLIYRRALKAGMPKAYLKSYNDFLEVGKGWEWVDEYNIPLSDGTEVFCTHGMTADGLKLAMQYGKHTCQFHFHSKFTIGYFSNPDKLIWSLQCGCLIKQSHMAFEYAKNFKSRFIVGTAMILDGQPKLFPMVLNKEGKWIGKLV